jgi:hypothetical protein
MELLKTLTREIFLPMALSAIAKVAEKKLAPKTKPAS